MFVTEFHRNAMKMPILSLVLREELFIPWLRNDSFLAAVCKMEPKPTKTNTKPTSTLKDALMLSGVTRGVMFNKDRKSHLQMQRAAMLLGLGFVLFFLLKFKPWIFQQFDWSNRTNNLNQGLFFSLLPPLYHSK